MIPNIYMGNGSLTKNSFKTGCLKFQVTVSAPKLSSKSRDEIWGSFWSSIDKREANKGIIEIICACTSQGIGATQIIIVFGDRRHAFILGSSKRVSTKIDSQVHTGLL